MKRISILTALLFAVVAFQGIAVAEFDVERAVAQSASTDESVAARVFCYNTDNTAPTLAITSCVMTFTKQGTTADSNIMGVSTAGQIDCTSTAYDSWGELCAKVNVDASGWRIVLVGALPTDKIYSTNAKICDLTATATNTDAGAAILFDLSNFGYARGCIGYEAITGNASSSLDGGSIVRRQDRATIKRTAESSVSAGSPVSQSVNRAARCTYVAISTTGSGGSNTFTLYEAKQDDYTGTSVNPVFTAAGGASGVAYTLPTSHPSIQGRYGYRLVASYGGLTTTTAQSMYVDGELAKE